MKLTHRYVTIDKGALDKVNGTMTRTASYSPEAMYGSSELAEIMLEKAGEITRLSNELLDELSGKYSAIIVLGALAYGAKTIVSSMETQMEDPDARLASTAGAHLLLAELLDGMLSDDTGGMGL